MSTDGEGSVTRWIAELKGGDAEAARALWGRYFGDLIRIAREKLRATRRTGADEDEEDAALRAFDSFRAGAARGQFPQLVSPRSSPFSRKRWAMSRPARSPSGR